MWNDNKSLVLSKICVIVFIVLLITAAILTPSVVSRLTDISSNARQAGAGLFLATIYIGSVPAAALLVSMYMLLRRISAGDVFVKENVSSLRFISWCFFVGAVIGTASAFYFIAWLPIGIAAAFMCLVVRVVKNVIAKAVSLQDDADFTI